MMAVFGIILVVLFTLGLVICAQGMDMDDEFVFLAGVIIILVASAFLVIHP